MLKSAISPNITKFILENNPVLKKRAAIWFFEKEFKEQLEAAEKERNKSNDIENSKVIKRPKKSEIRKLWVSMQPESKRKYFNLAKFDELRYVEQRALWMAKIGTLLVKNGDTVDKLGESLLDQDTIKKELLEIERHHKNYERMIQALSTRLLYKKVVENTEVETHNLEMADLISAVPKNYRPILSRPRRPASEYLLYVSDNKDKLNEIRKKEYPQLTFSQAAAKEWEKASQDERLFYENKYAKLLGRYKEAMVEFKRENSNSDENCLEQAAKERAAYRRSLRRRLREFTVVPVNVRNSFTFFLMEHKDIPLSELTEIWRGMSEEEKEKYKKMNEHDTARYYSHKSANIGIMEKLNELFNKSVNQKKPKGYIK